LITQHSRFEVAIDTAGSIFLMTQPFTRANGQVRERLICGAQVTKMGEAFTDRDEKGSLMVLERDPAVPQQCATQGDTQREGCLPEYPAAAATANKELRAVDGTQFNPNPQETLIPKSPGHVHRCGSKHQIKEASHETFSADLCSADNSAHSGCCSED
jgi:hypothetical protein